MTIPLLLSATGREALHLLCRTQPLLAFDFDGTLAPIVRNPDDASVPPAVASRLARLNSLRPVAIISGRRRQDVLQRLPFAPRFIVGNHGAETETDPPFELVQPLDALRHRIRLHAEHLRDAGVTVEDKGLSLALHYRRAPSHRRALRALSALARRPPPGVRLFGGHCVLNAAPADASDKADALDRLMSVAACGSALFVGDDVNDEPVFERGRPEWLTVRIGDEAATPTRARFRLRDAAEIPTLLDCLLEALGGTEEPA